mmetsp:Transcript_2935/g.4696  ORF Transcript_2935/g.4696 Transcript_2935/m.4696 type:complete len:102 (+) Transcript_2935:363-668(+)
MPLGVASCLLIRRHTSVSVSPCLCSRQKERERASEVSLLGVEKQPCTVCNRQGKSKAIHRGMQVKTCACLPFGVKMSMPVYGLVGKGRDAAEAAAACHRSE